MSILEKENAVLTTNYRCPRLHGLTRRGMNRKSYEELTEAQKKNTEALEENEEETKRMLQEGSSDNEVLGRI